MYCCGFYTTAVFALVQTFSTFTTPCFLVLLSPHSTFNRNFLYIFGESQSKVCFISHSHQMITFSAFTKTKSDVMI